MNGCALRTSHCVFPLRTGCTVCEVPKRFAKWGPPAWCASGASAVLIAGVVASRDVRTGQLVGSQVGVAPQELGLDEGDVFDLAGVDTLVRGVNEALGFFDAEEHDLRVGVGLGEHVAQRDRPALTL